MPECDTVTKHEDQERLDNIAEANAMADGLEAFAHFVRANPGLKRPSFADSEIRTLQVQLDGSRNVTAKEELRRYMQALGKITKQSRGDFYMIIKDFGGGVLLEIWVPSSQICERILVEETLVPERRMAAVAAHIEPAHTKKIYGWRCPDSILRPDTDDAAKQQSATAAKGEAIDA